MHLNTRERYQPSPISKVHTNLPDIDASLLKCYVSTILRMTQHLQLQILSDDYIRLPTYLVLECLPNHSKSR